MAHPEIDNRTPFAVTPLFIADEDGRPIVVPVIKATFDVSLRGDVTLGETQVPVDFKGKHYGEPIHRLLGGKCHRRNRAQGAQDRRSAVRVGCSSGGRAHASHAWSR